MLVISTEGILFSAPQCDFHAIVTNLMSTPRASIFVNIRVKELLLS